MTMQAMVLTGLQKMERAEIRAPKIEHDTDVLLKVGAVGVCGSDVHYYLTGRIGSQVVQYPYRVGHEFAGTVMQTGKKVQRFKPGDRVAVDPAMACGECDQCRAGRHHTCRRLRFLGCPGQADGCLSEYIVMPEECCFTVGKMLTLEEAALAEPVSIGLYAVQMSIPMRGARIGILGCGPIGMSVLLAALAGSVERAFVTDKIDARLDLAGRLGAHWAGNPDRQAVVEEISKQEPLLLDAVFECCGQQDALDQAVDLLKPGGKLMLIGIPQTDRISFPIDPLRRREVCIQNVRRQNARMAAAIDFLVQNKQKADALITHRFGFDDTKKAFDLVASYGDGVMKAMIEVG